MWTNACSFFTNMESVKPSIFVRKTMIDKMQDGSKKNYFNGIMLVCISVM